MEVNNKVFVFIYFYFKLFFVNIGGSSIVYLILNIFFNIYSLIL